MSLSEHQSFVLSGVAVIVTRRNVRLLDASFLTVGKVDPARYLI
jgi:hypothetical protein